MGYSCPAVYNFAGGDVEWATSGQSRLVLIQRVVQVTMRNPITGLGPAAYRSYTAMEPLLYGKAYWISPQNQLAQQLCRFVLARGHPRARGFSSGLPLKWARLGIRLRRRYTDGFASGYVNAVLVCWRRVDSDHDVGGLDLAFCLQHWVPRIPGERPCVAIHWRVADARKGLST